MQKVEWGEFKIQEVLQWQPQIEIDPLKLKDLTDQSEKVYPFYGQATTNNGIISYNQLKKSALNNDKAKPTILIHSNNQNIVYLETPFYLKDGHGATSVLQSKELNKTNQMFIIGAIDRVIKTKYSYNNKATKIELKNSTIQLPTKNKKIDYDFMQNFIAELSAQRIAELSAQRIAELSAHLKVTGLNNYVLTAEEKQVLQDFENGQLLYNIFNFKNIFDTIRQGRRLKKEDQILGDIPFVMAGTTNTGIVKYISNPVASFPENSITIDIFGNTFYRSYNYGAGDDTGVYWNSENECSKTAMLFLTSTISKLVAGKFDFGNKLRSSQSLDFKIAIPINKNNKPDYALMETFITAIQKLVIKDVVDFADQKIEATIAVTN